MFDDLDLEAIIEAMDGQMTGMPPYHRIELLEALREQIIIRLEEAELELEDLDE